jgi:hypothetical protein
MTDETQPTDKSQPDAHPGWRSREADGAAARWGEQHPDDDVDHPPPSSAPERPDDRLDRHSASAEAASLRWREQHEDEQDDE